MEFTLEYIQENLYNLGVKQASSLLKEWVISSNESLTRQKALWILKSIDNGKNFNFFEQLYLSDEDHEIITITGIILREKYLRDKKLISLLDYILSKGKKVNQRIFALETLNLVNNTKSRKIIYEYLKELQKTYFKEKISQISDQILAFDVSNSIPEPLIETCINFILYNYYTHTCGYYVAIRDGKIISLSCEASSIKSVREITEFERLIHLEHFVLQGNKLQLIEGFEHLHKLKTLNLNNNLIEKVENLGGLTKNLEELDLSNNKIQKIENLESFESLKKLYLESNYIRKIQGLDSVFNLEELNLSHNYISKIENLDNLLNLKKLNLSFNRIEQISGLNRLENLLWLYLNDNLIKDVENLESLKKLKGLYLTNNKIKNLKNLNHLINLKKLELSNNNIKKIEGLDNLKKLQELFLDKNKIERLEGLESLVNLIILFLEANNISEFSNEKIEGLKNLNFIFLNENPLTPESWDFYKKKTKFP